MKREESVNTSERKPYCEYCNGAKPLVIGKTNDYGIAIIGHNLLMAYGYDVHGSGSNGLSVQISYCPKCGAKVEAKE